MGAGVADTHHQQDHHYDSRTTVDDINPHYLNDPKLWECGIFLITDNAGFISSTVPLLYLRHPKGSQKPWNSLASPREIAPQHGAEGE